jgi:hypothetical protein
MAGTRAMLSQDPTPRAIFATVAHDNWCRLLNGKGDCNCNPTIEYRQHVAPKQ